MHKLQLLFVSFVLITCVNNAQQTHNIINNPPNEYLSGLYSSMFPGAGYHYLGKTEKAILSTMLIIPIAANYYLTTPDYIAMSLKKNFYFASVNLSRFAAYDSYQSALDIKGRYNRIIDIPHYTFNNFLISPFSTSTYKFKNSSSYTMLIPLGLIATVPVIRIIKNGTADNLKPGNVLLSVSLIFAQSLLFAIGEESYFRGYIFPAASELTGSKWIGNLIQSLYFGFSHTDVAERIGFKQFPHVSGTIFHFTSTIDELKEYAIPKTTASDFAGLKDLQRLALFAGMGFGLGMLTSECQDGLLKATLLHTCITFVSILTDYITEGNTGKFCIGITLN